MNTSQTHIDKDDAHKSPERLEQEVNQARARIDERLETLSNRLSPGELLDQILGMAREHGGEFTRNLGSQVKNNPVPLLITGIGMSWLMMASNTPRYQAAAQRRAYGTGYDHSGKSSPRYTDGFSEYPYTEGSSYGDDYEKSMNNDRARSYSYNGTESHDRDDEPDVMDKAKEAMGRVGEKVEHLKGAARDRMERASERAHQGAGAMRHNMQSAQQNMRTAQECMTDFLYDQPVLAASLGVALGAAIGAMLPATEVESRVLGSASEQTLHKAQEMASEQYGMVREKARNVAENVKQTMQGNPETQTSDYAAGSAQETNPTNQAS